MSKRLKSRGEFARSLEGRLEAHTRANSTRDYIGASVLGRPCDRELYYVHERVPQPSLPGRVLRIFEFGNSIETLVVQWLRDVGMHVYDLDPRTGRQFNVRTEGGLVGGHSDGIVADAPLTPALFSPAPTVCAVVEIKSHKQSRFDEVADLGVKAAKFDHYAQLQYYLDNSDQMLRAFAIRGRIDRGLYVAVNKDTSEIYLEDVPHDAADAIRLTSRAIRVTTARAPYPRLASSADKQPCKYCDFKVHCFADQREVIFQQRTCDASPRSRRVESDAPAASHIRSPEWEL